MRAASDPPSRIGLTCGDPSGIGPEIVLKALAALSDRRAYRVYGSREVLDERADRFGLERAGKLGVEVHDVEARTEIPLGTHSAGSGSVAARSIQAACADALAGRIVALVTAPINKRSLKLAGYEWPGHTEMLADLTKSNDVAMMFVGGGLRVALVTIHQALRDVPGSIEAAEVARIVRLVHWELPGLGATRRSIACCGVNPHAGEAGLFGDEERRVLEPALAELRSEGIEVAGPFPADTIFPRASRGEFDAVIAMYHDQGLIPVKLAASGRAVNVTLGLPFVRTSVDHGTAFEIAAAGTAEESSLLAAIRLAEDLSARRSQARR